MKELILIFLLFSSLPSLAQSPKEIYNHAKNSIIYLSFEKIENNQKALNFGTGFIVEKNLLITNSHLVAENLIAKDSNNNEIKIVKVLKNDEKNDLAVILIENNKSLESLKLAKNNAEIGDEIIVLGNPAGFQNTLSRGLISNLKLIKSMNKIIFNAPIAQGSSGSPILNENGEVIGVVEGLYLGNNAQNLNVGINLKELKDLIDSK